MELNILLQLAQFAGYVICATIFIVMIKADVKILRVEVKAMSKNIEVLNSSFDRLGTILTQVAVQDARLNGIEDDVRELKHGKGFIHDALNGQYGRK